MQDPVFKNKAGIKLPGFTPQVLEACFARLWELGMSPEQISEAASYSLAMVVRYALGLSGEDSRVAIFASDALPGWVALASARHLINAGATAELILPAPSPNYSKEFERQLKPLRSMRANFHNLSQVLAPDSASEAQLSLEQIVRSCHNLVWGCVGTKAPDQLSALVERLNDLSTPVHCVGCPPGLDQESGKILFSPLYASSTLSLGAPLSGLYFGSDYVGRHYLCDVSFTSEIYNQAGFDLSPLFAEQPVVQIFPENEDQTKPDS